MTSSPADPSTLDPADVGLLLPVVVGTAVERCTGDQAVVQAMLRAEGALLGALAETGIAPAQAAAAADGLLLHDVSPRTLAMAATVGGNPVIPLVKLLREQANEDLAAWIHFGATSQDILDTALMLIGADALRHVESDLFRLAQTLAGLTRALREVPAVARTLSQQALPTTMGFRAAGWLAGVHDAMRAVHGVQLPASLGGPVGSTPAYRAAGPAVLQAYARRLGLTSDAISGHTRRTPVLQLAAAGTAVGSACGTIAENVLVLAQTEVGEVHEATAGGSSSMPHKANPAQSVLVVSAARQIPALAAVLGASAVTGTERPSGPWHAEWEPLRSILRLSGAAAERTAGLAAGLVFDRAAMQRNLDDLCRQLGSDPANDPAWVHNHVEATLPWVDRVLDAHERTVTSRTAAP